MGIKIYSHIAFLFFFLLCLGTLFLSSASFVNAQIAPKEYAFIFCSAAILITGALYVLFGNPQNLRFHNFVLPVCLIITVLCLAQAFYGIAQFLRWLPSIGKFRITGSFDNPAGFAASLCAGFPFFFYFLTRKEKWMRIASIIGMAIIVFAVFLSGSRAGMVALAAVCILGVFYFFRTGTKQKIAVGIFLAILITGLYFYKKDSADGRLLIWRCSWEMIKEKPIIGYGQGGFKANYMNWQAAYFEAHPDSKQAMLADNINRPFNEYIGLLVNYGFAGFLLFLLLVFYLIRTFRRIPKKTIITYIAVWCLTAIAIFAFFSYPLRYPFVWVAGLLSVSVVLLQGNATSLRGGTTKQSRKKRYKVKGKLFTLSPLTFYLSPATMSVLILLIAPVVCFKSYSRLLAEMKWTKIAHKSLAGQTEQMLPEYKLLYPQLRNNELFLYNYTAELNFIKRYEESLTIAHECERLWADYDLQMLVADNCWQLKDYTQAEQHYRKAAAMCPAKFVPLYQLAKMLDVTGRSSDAVALAKQIVNKPIKISSPQINAIQREMRQLIEREEKNDSIPETIINKPIENQRQGNEAAEKVQFFVIASEAKQPRKKRLKVKGKLFTLLPLTFHLSPALSSLDCFASLAMTRTATFYEASALPP